MGTITIITPRAVYGNTIGGGGGVSGNPGGTTTQIQFNDGGVFSCAS